jgi:uncharacterized protein (DUF2141 family)
MPLPFWRLVLAVSCLSLTPVEAADLTIHIAGLRHTRGTIRLSLYDRAEAFLEPGGRIARLKEQVTTNPMRVSFTGLPPGTYAVTVVHDENDNGKLDRNLLGVPREGYGFSNDAPIILGPPSFARVAVLLGQEDKAIIITIRY